VYQVLKSGSFSGARDFLDETRHRLYEFEWISPEMPDILFRTNIKLVEKTRHLMRLGEEYLERDRKLNRIKSHWSWSLLSRIYALIERPPAN